MKYWTSRTASKHLYSNECGPDCSCSSLLTLTMSSALPPAGGWGPLPEWRFVARPTTPQLQKPPGCWVQLSSDTDTTNFFLFFAFVHIWEDRGGGGASLLDPDVFLFCFLWVSICASTEGLTLYRGFTKNSTARGRLTGDQWSNCVFVCLETPILFLSGKTNRTGCRLSCAPEATTWGGLFIAFSGTSFLSSLFVFYFLLRNVIFCTCAMQLYRRFLGQQEQLLLVFFLLDSLNQLHLR